MALELRKMTADELERYLQTSIPAYAEDKMRNESIPKADALILAKNSFDSLLPEGVETKDHYLFSVFTDTSRIGVLWFARKNNYGRSFAWIYDIILDEAFRGRGFGKELMTALEGEVKKQNLTSIALHVFGSNDRARSLYEKMGYLTTNYTMKKDLI